MSKKGVHYNNIDNKENKENKENICEMNNSFSPSIAGREADASPKSIVSLSSSGQETGLDEVSGYGTSQPTPLDDEQIKRALVQLFDNGEDVAQRYKIKVKLNLVDDEDPEFIASMTRDYRNFKKYIPSEGKDQVLEFAKEMRSAIKSKYGTYPYLGKFHLNQGQGRHIHSQVEPFTAAAIWYDQENKGWSGAVMLYDWIHQFDLTAEYLTDKQKKMRIRGQDLYVNPKHDNRQRPLTWAEQRRLKK